MNAQMNPENPMPAVEVIGVSRRYGPDSVALNDVSMTVDRGEFMASPDRRGRARRRC